jgi:hypothetical protein
MTWRELLTRLDELRIQLRAEHGKELDKVIPEGDELAADIKEVMQLDSAVSILHPQPSTQLDDLFACAPSPSANSVKEIVERGDGEGRMLVMERSTPFVVRKPDLVEVDEKELGK